MDYYSALMAAASTPPPVDTAAEQRRLVDGVAQSHTLRIDVFTTSQFETPPAAGGVAASVPANDIRREVERLLKGSGSRFSWTVDIQRMAVVEGHWSSHHSHLLKIAQYTPESDANALSEPQPVCHAIVVFGNPTAAIGAKSDLEKILGLQIGNVTLLFRCSWVHDSVATARFEQLSKSRQRESETNGIDTKLPIAAARTELRTTATTATGADDEPRFLLLVVPATDKKIDTEGTAPESLKATNRAIQIIATAAEAANVAPPTALSHLEDTWSKSVRVVLEYDSATASETARALFASQKVVGASLFAGVRPTDEANAKRLETTAVAANRISKTQFDAILRGRDKVMGSALK